MHWTVIALVMLAFPLVRSCDGCDNPEKFTQDINGDGQIDADDDPCCYPGTWKAEICMCDEEYERRYGHPKPASEVSSMSQSTLASELPGRQGPEAVLRAMSQ